MPSKSKKNPVKKNSRKNYSRAVSNARKNSVPKTERSSSFFSPVGGYLGGLAGGALGGPMGAGIGSTLGSSAGSLISKLTGFGSYKVKKNTLIDDSIPQFMSRMGDGSIRIRHKEFINDVISSATPGAFLPITYNVSASESTTFPYLAALAVNFEEFAFEGLVFEFITSSGSLSTTGQLGTVVGAMQYNSLSIPYANKQQMEASTFSESTVASQSCLFPIECDAAQTPSNGIFYNVRGGISSTNNDPRWSQLGKFTLATVGMPNASETVGELYVSYDVVLMKPYLVQDTNALADHYAASAGVTVSNYFGNYVLSSQSDGFTSLTGTTISFDPSFFGSISISYFITGAAGAWVPPTMTGSLGATDKNLIAANTLNGYDSVAQAAGALVTQTTYYFNIRPSGGVRPLITLSAGTYFTPTYVDLLIIQIPDDLN